MKKIRNLVLGLSIFGATEAQGQSPLAPIKPVLRSGQRDTIRGLNNFYQQHRQGGIYWSLAAFSGLGLLARIVANPDRTTLNGVTIRSETDVTSLAVVGGAMALSLTVGVIKLVNSSHGKQKAAVEAYRNGQPLPRRIGLFMKPEKMKATGFQN